MIVWGLVLKKEWLLKETEEVGGLCCSKEPAEKYLKKLKTEKEKKNTKQWLFTCCNRNLKVFLNMCIDFAVNLSLFVIFLKNNLNFYCFHCQF